MSVLEFVSRALGEKEDDGREADEISFLDGENDSNENSEANSEAGLNSNEDYESGSDGERDSDEDSYVDAVNSNDGEEVGRSLYSLEADNTDTSDEEEVRNTLGNVPLEWYEDYCHLGYDVEGHKLPKPSSAASDELDEFLSKMENPEYWRTIRDKLSGKEVVLTDDQVDMIQKLQKSSYPELGMDPYMPYVEHFSSEKEPLPLSRVPKPKTSFIPSKWEHKTIVRLVHAIRMGRMKPHQRVTPRPVFYQLWGEGGAKGRGHQVHIPAPRVALPGHGESYNPPPEFLPTTQEEQEWLAEDEKDRSTDFLSHRYNSLREVPSYLSFIKERFERCLDLYLCPRQRKMRVNVDLEDLIPKLPPLRDLQPFPTTEALVYKGHSGIVLCVAVEAEGQWLASACSDNSVRLWEVATARCTRTLSFDNKPVQVCFSPNTQHSILAIAVGNEVVLMNTCLGDHLVVKRTHIFLDQLPISPAAASEEEEMEGVGKCVVWVRKCGGGGVCLKHMETVQHVCWHHKGDYLATVTAAASTSVLIHQFSKVKSQRPFKKVKGQVQTVSFHPFKPLFFLATQTSVRVYDLMRQELMKRLLSGVKWISSMAVHPSGDHILLASYDKKICWFDCDLSSMPYKVLRQHRQAVRCVCFHPSLPLFASCSDDGTVIVCHGKVFSDLLQNPEIVPVKQLHASARVQGLGVLWCMFHPSQPWLFTAGADATIRLFTN